MKILLAILLTAILVSSNVQAQDLSPQPQTVNGVTFVSGGVGDREKEEMLSMKKEYNLHLLFVDKGTGAYMSGIRVKILDAKGTTILDSVSNGPFFYVQLNPGKYRITASVYDQEQTQPTVISAKKTVSKTFYFKAQKAPAE
jgi:hypothetical protein